tara:strand:+ start:43 stop:261 length:219 start_codon:yes stop_codon:yes gene_type:complete
MEELMQALKKKYESEVDIANATIKVYLEKPVGVSEHSHFAEEVDKQLEIIGCALDKIKVINKYYPSEDEIPF